MSAGYRVTCDDCPFDVTRDSPAKAQFALRRHRCDLERERAAVAARVAARRAALVARPRTACTHGGKHQHGQATTYNVGCCKCVDCTDAATRTEMTRQRRAVYGRPTTDFVDAAPVREHLARLRADKTGLRVITERSGVAGTTLRKIAAGRARVTPATRDAVLAVPVVVAAGVHVSPVPTVRRVQALACAGWSMAAQATRLGLERRTLWAVLGRRSVTVRTAQLVAGAYPGMLADGPPAGTREEKRSVTIARSRAVAAGWFDDGAWEDIDDEAAVPGWGAASSPVDVVADAPADGTGVGGGTELSAAAAALVEDVEWLVRWGGTWESVAKQTDRSRRSIAVVLREADRRDLLQVLAVRAA